MAFTIYLSHRARLDILKAEEWVKARGTSVFTRWRSRWLGIVRNLEENPMQYPLAEEAPKLGIELKEAIFGRRRNVYRVLFTIEGGNGLHSPSSSCR